MRSPVRSVIAIVADAVVDMSKGEAASPGKSTPTEKEAAWMAAIVEHGCVACIIDGQQPRLTAVHHILRGGQRMGHLYTLPLCDPGHHQGGAEFGLISRHPWRKRFEEKYGTEMDLLMHLRRYLAP
jgi:hypothetical protein